MAWSWSHTAEAYATARENLEELPRDTLEEICDEWALHDADEGHPADEEVDIPNLPDDVLVDYIWERAEEQALCDNGGWAAWVCPYGCHTVPFSRGNPDEEPTENPSGSRSRIDAKGALQDLYDWAMRAPRGGNPYMVEEVRNALRALSGTSRSVPFPDLPARRPRAKVEGALYDLTHWALHGERYGLPENKPEVKAAAAVLGGTASQNPSSPTSGAMGLCYEWAYREVIGDKSGESVLVHGTVNEPFARPPKAYTHAWVERDGTVYDWQTMVAHHGGKFMGQGYPRDVFYDLYKPKKIKTYTADEARTAMLSSPKARGKFHYGPWGAATRNPSQEDLALVDQAVLRHVGVGATVATLTHDLTNAEGMVVSKTQVAAAARRLVKAGKLWMDDSYAPPRYRPAERGTASRNPSAPTASEKSITRASLERTISSAPDPRARRLPGGWRGQRADRFDAAHEARVRAGVRWKTYLLGVMRDRGVDHLTVVPGMCSTMRGAVQSPREDNQPKLGPLKFAHPCHLYYDESALVAVRVQSRLHTPQRNKYDGTLELGPEV